MHKLPVMATYANVMRFSFGRFLTTLRLAWLPVLALLVTIAAHFAVQFQMMTRAFPHRAPEGVPDIQVLTQHLELMIATQAALFLLQLIATSAVAVSIHRVILFGDTKPGVWFNFPFGATELRFLVMGLLYVLMMIAVLVLVVGPVLFAVTGGDMKNFFADWPARAHGMMSGGRFAPVIAAYLVGWLIVLYLFVRLAAWPPSVVATGRLSPAEPWRLTRGNFWRLIGLFALTLVTLYAIFIPVVIAVATLMATRFRDVVGDPQAGQTLTMTPDSVLEMLLPVLPFLAAAYFLLIIFVTGVTVALLSYAYKALKGYDAKTPIPTEG